MNYNKTFRYALVPYLILLASGQAQAIDASFMEGQFEEVMYIPKVENIEAWEQPRTQYTPKNLTSEYQIRYSGTDLNGRNSYSYTTHFTDYDTYITGNGVTEDGKYYVQQNNGKAYVTGEKARDFTPEINNLNQLINNNTDNINSLSQSVTSNTDNINSLNKSVINNANDIKNNSDSINVLNKEVNINRRNIEQVNTRANTNTKAIKDLSGVVNNNSNRIDNMSKNVNINTSNIKTIASTVNGNTRDIARNTASINNMRGELNNISDRVDVLDNRIDRVNDRMKQGFATVTALTSLHPNPRSNEKLEVSIGTGIYQDTMAGAIGLFYHPNDRVQIYAGGAYGGHDSWAGGAGITFSIGGRKHARQ